MKPRSILGLGVVVAFLIPLTQAQNQKAPLPSYDPRTGIMRLDWQSNVNRTFFPQVSTDLINWNYVPTLHFGKGAHVGMMQSDGEETFYRLQYSDFPVATEEEAGTADFDFDGLGNLEELLQYGTDPLGPDLDKDGRPDGWDTDKDGLPDGWEIARSISPLDNGTRDPANGPNGVFSVSYPSGPDGPPAAISNLQAFQSGVQSDPSATLADKDGDGIPDALDAGPASRSIDWEVSLLPQFVYMPIQGYDYDLHGVVNGCNDRGEVIAAKALYSGGSWNPLAKSQTGPTAAPQDFKFRVNGRIHGAYLNYQPTPRSVSNQGRIVGEGTVEIHPLTELINGVDHVYAPGSTVMAFVWDSWSTKPTLLGHAPNAILEGKFWNEYASISTDGTAVLRRFADTTAALNQELCLIRHQVGGGVSSTGPFSSGYSFGIGERGFTVYDTGYSNAFFWPPDATVPRSIAASSIFSTPNSRTSIDPRVEPRPLGHKPGDPEGLCIRFWGKTMIWHESRWQEARELATASLITSDGSALMPGGQVWKGGRKRSLSSSVLNKDLSSEIVEVNDTTSDGRLLIRHYHPGNTVAVEAGFLMPVSVVSRDKFIAGSLELPQGWDNLELEFVRPGGESLGRYGSLLGGGGTRIYNDVTDILSEADVGAGGQSASQKVWFVRNPSNPRKIDYYTCFNATGAVEIRIYRNGSPVPTAKIPHTLQVAEDFASTIAYVDAWVKGTSFNWNGGGDPPLFVPPPGAFGASGAGEDIDNLTRACLIPFFNVVNQVEGAGNIVHGLLQGAKAGIEDDWAFIELIGQGVVLAGDWAYQSALQELEKWQTNPTVRALQLKQMVDRFCEDMIFQPLQQFGQQFSTWEGIRKQAWRAWEASLGIAQQSWAITKDLWGSIVDGMIAWADDFCNRMMAQSERVHWQNSPWAKDRLLAEINSTTRMACYTFGYTFGYLGEQVAVGVLTGGSAKIAQVVKKGGMVLAGTLGKRTAAVLAARAHFLKRLLAEVAQIPTDLAASYQRGFALAATEPVGVGMPRVALEVMQEGVESGRMVWREYVEGITTKANINKLVRQGGEAVIEKRFAQLMHILGPDFDAAIGRNFLKVVDELILVPRADGTVDDFFEGFLRAMEGNPSLLKNAELVEFQFGGIHEPMSANGKARLKHILSDPDAGNPWKLDDPQWVEGEPIPIPHNYWARGVLLELQQFKKVYKQLGYGHNANAEAFDYFGPKWVQMKSLSNPDGAISKMIAALDDLIDNTPDGELMRLHILKKPNSSSAALESAFEAKFVGMDPALRQRIEILIEVFDPGNL